MISSPDPPGRPCRRRCAHQSLDGEEGGADRIGGAHGERPVGEDRPAGLDEKGQILEQLPDSPFGPRPTAGGSSRRSVAMAARPRVRRMTASRDPADRHVGRRATSWSSRPSRPPSRCSMWVPGAGPCRGQRGHPAVNRTMSTRTRPVAAGSALPCGASAACSGRRRHAEGVGGRDSRSRPASWPSFAERRVWEAPGPLPSHRCRRCEIASPGPVALGQARAPDRPCALGAQMRLVPIPLQLLAHRRDQAARSRRWARTPDHRKAFGRSLPSGGGNSRGPVASLAGFLAVPLARLRSTRPPLPASRPWGPRGPCGAVCGVRSRRQTRWQIDRAFCHSAVAPPTRSRCF